MEDIVDENVGRLVYTIADAGNLVAIAVAAERAACAKAVERARLQIDGAFGVTHQTDFIATHITDFYVATIRARGDQ